MLIKKYSANVSDQHVSPLINKFCETVNSRDVRKAMTIS